MPDITVETTQTPYHSKYERVRDSSPHFRTLINWSRESLGSPIGYMWAQLSKKNKKTSRFSAQKVVYPG